MIRLPQLFKRKPETEDFDRASVGMRRTPRNTAPRSLQRAKEAEELALTEDPEQQRARHRLIGAAVLVLIAVVALPRILDSQPKAMSNDIAINIVTSLPSTQDSASTLSPKPQENVTSTPAVAPPQPKEVVKSTPEPKIEKKSDVKIEPKKEVAQSAPDKVKTPAMGLAAGEEVVTSASDSKATESTEKLPAVNAGSKFIIQIGAFASQDRANGWISKMKEQKIPHYVLNKTNSSGVKLYVLRAGPFTDKAVADSAETKLKAMGLTPRVVEVGAP
jgi:DedD protein